MSERKVKSYLAKPPVSNMDAGGSVVFSLGARSYRARISETFSLRVPRNQAPHKVHWNL